MAEELQEKMAATGKVPYLDEGNKVILFDGGARRGLLPEKRRVFRGDGRTGLSLESGAGIQGAAETAEKLAVRPYRAQPVPDLREIRYLFVADAGGVREILLGGALLFLRRTLLPVYAAIAALVLVLLLLLLDVTIMMPALLGEAFNPVTLNLAVIFIAYVVIVTQAHK